MNRYKLHPNITIDGLVILHCNTPYNGPLSSNILRFHTAGNLLSTNPDPDLLDSGLIYTPREVPSIETPHVLIVSPHADDAALSCAGRMLKTHSSVKYSIVTVFKAGGVSRYFPLSTEELQIFNMAEDRAVAEALGANHFSFEFQEAMVRTGRWNVTKSYCEPRIEGLVMEQLLSLTRQVRPDELWFPLGLGNHIDHLLLRNVEGAIPCKIRFYEDQPYGAEIQRKEVEMVLKEITTGLQPDTIDITNVIEKKIQICSMYHTQYDRSYLEKLRTFASWRGNGDLIEFLWVKS